MAEGSLAALQSVLDFLLTEFSDMATTLLEMPLFLVGVGFFVAGGLIGLVKRVTR